MLCVIFVEDSGKKLITLDTFVDFEEKYYNCKNNSRKVSAVIVRNAVPTATVNVIAAIAVETPTVVVIFSVTAAENVTIWIAAVIYCFTVIQAFLSFVSYGTFFQFL